jgi:guanylate kinase
VTPRQGVPFVVSAPSGTGKTTVCKQVVARLDGIAFSISHTTRAPREGERDGVDYHFVSAERFRALVERDAFLEYAEYAGRLYGTSRAAVDGPLREGRDLILEIEVQGAAQVRERRPDARFVFLLPPSAAELERRLRARGTDDAEAIERRLALMRRELAAVHLFDYVLVNDRLERCVEEVCGIVAAERAGDTAGVRARFGREAVLPGLRDRFDF